MGRKVQEKNSNSYWDKHHHPEFNRNLLHIIKHHPLYHHLIKRNAAGNVSQRDQVFSDDKNKNINLAEIRNSNVEENFIPRSSSVGKNTLRRQVNALIKEISKRKSRIKSCLQCDANATPRSDYLRCKHQPKKNGSSTKFRKMNNDILLTFLHDPVSPLIHSLHKKHVYKSKMTLTRSLSSPLPRGYAIIEPINNGSLTKGHGKSYSGNKLRVNGNINTNEAVVVRDASFSSGSSQVKNLKQKLDNITGESGKEKVRVAMDSVIDKIPQGCNGISDELKNEILNKLTDKVYSPLKRIWSLQEPLERYWQYQDNSFKPEKAYSPLRTRTDKVYSPLGMVIPFKRILSLPDLQSYSHDASLYGDISEISSLIEPIIASKDDNVISESMVYQKKIVDHNVHSKSQLQLDTLEDFTQENIVNVEENDLLVNIIAASDSKSKPGHVEQEATKDYPKVNETTKNTQKMIPNLHVDTTNKDEFNYVKYVLEISGLTTNECHSAWHSRDTPIDPLLYEEMEGDPDFCSYESGKCNHHELFDLINETLLEIYGRSNSYTPLKFNLHEVWSHMRKILCLRSKVGQQTIDDHVTRDLLKVDGWVNLQFYDHFVGLELEDLIFHDLLGEIIWDLA